MTIFLATAVNHLVAAWIGLPKPVATYRRIGPQSGPQVFCAGSSVMQFGLSWPEISDTIGQGIENWGLGGSTPTEWEVSQSLATDTNLMIIGVSEYELNEQHLCDSRANVASAMQTIEDLWQTKAGWQFSKHVLSQYPLACARTLFPTAGRSDAVLVGLRRNVLGLTGREAPAEEKANAMVLPSEAVLDFGASTEKLSDWPADKTLRRLDLMRTEFHGLHWFGGPKKLAFHRMLNRAQRRGRVIVVVMPLAPTYVHEFLKRDVVRDFEDALHEAQHTAPQALFVRLDEVPLLKSDEYYSDFVHLNGAGRRIATDAFLKALPPDFRLP